MTPFFKLKNDNHGHDYILSYESHFIKKYKPSLNESKQYFPYDDYDMKKNPIQKDKCKQKNNMQFLKY